MNKSVFGKAILIALLGLPPLFAFADVANAPPSLSNTASSDAEKRQNDWYSHVEAEAKAGRGRAQVPSLIALIDGPDADKRELAAQLLSDIGNDASDAVPSLIRHINDPDFFPRLRCIEALGDIGPDASPAIPDLINVLNDPTWQIVNMAADSLGDIGPKAQQAVPALESLLQRPKDSDRYASVAVTTRIALARITGKSGLQVMALVSMLSEKDDDKNENWPAFEATRGLGYLMPSSKATLPLIGQELLNQNTSFTTREAAARDLGVFGAPEGVPFLEKAIHDDPNFTVRSAAIDALGKIQAPQIDTAQLHRESQAKEWANTLKALEPINKKLEPFTSELPPVTSVEVYRVDAYMNDPSSKRQPPKDAELFPMRPDGYTLVITGKSTLNGDDAEKLASEWRHLSFGVQYQALCHFPIYGLKFISGKQLLLQTTICWHCSDFSLPEGGYGGFNSHQESSNILKNHLETLLPPIKK